MQRMMFFGLVVTISVCSASFATARSLRANESSDATSCNTIQQSRANPFALAKLPARNRSIILYVAQTPKNDKATKVSKFLLESRKASDGAKAALSKAISKRIAEIKRGPGDPDFKRLALEKIDQDREALQSSGRLPQSDELLDLTAKFLDTQQKIATKLEAFRKAELDDALRDDEKSGSIPDFEKFKSLERSIASMLAGREEFAKDTVWAGTRRSPTFAASFRLRVTEMAGSTFRGRLIQGDPPNEAIMEAQGKLSGGRIQLETTGMVKGPNRYFAISGYVLTGRIVAELQGIGVDKKPTSGWLSLAKIK
jgi:hypothetical protein